MRVEIALAAAELRHRPALWLLLALGSCLAGLLPVYAAGLAGDASRAATTAAVDALPASERSVLAVTTRVMSGADAARASQQVQAALTDVGVQRPSHSLTFRPLALAGQDVTVAAIDPLPAGVRLTTGRLPSRCRPTSCEVLAVTPDTGVGQTVTTAAQRAARGLGLVVTGTAVLTDSRLTGLGLAPPGAPLLLAAEPDQLGGLSALELFGRNTAWYGSIDGGAVARRGVGTVSQVLGALPETVGDAGPLAVSWPEAAVSAAADRAAQASTRLRALGTASGLLVLGFCVVVAAALRPRTQHLARVLTRRGARTGQVYLVLVLQAAAAVLTGLLLGAAGSVLWLGGRLAGSAPWSAALAAVTSCWPVLAALAVAAVLLTVLVTRWPADAAPLAGWALAAALLVTVGLPVLVLTSGTPATEGSLPTQLVMSLVVATGLLTALVWRPLLSLAHRSGTGTAGAGGQPGVLRRVAVLGARRRALLPMAAAALLATACCFAVFTAGYRSSLHSSAADQAAAVVPLDVRIDGSGTVPAPLDAVDVPALLAVSPGVAVHPVVGSSVTVFAGTEHPAAVPLTGLDPDALPAVHRFAATTGSKLSAAELAARLVPSGTASTSGPVLPTEARRISFAVRGWSDDITVDLWTARADGREERVPLRHAGTVLTGVLPAGPARQVRAIEVAESASHLMHRQHGVGEGTTDRALAGGRLVLGAAQVDAGSLDWSWATWGSDRATVRASAERLVADYRLAGTRVIFDPTYVPAAERPAIPVAVDPTTAARVGADGRLPLTVSGQSVPARVVAVLPRLPGVQGRFVLAERGQVAALLDRYAPGTAAVTQLWVSAPADTLPAVRTALAPAAAADVGLSYRADLETAIDDDPVSSRTTAFFSLVSAATVLLALVGLLTAVRADLETSVADQLALELDGVRPAGLRSVLRTRATLLLIGLPLGALGGVVVVRVAVRVLTLGPGGVPVDPPLRVVLPLLPALAAGLGGLLVALLGIGVLTAGAYRRPRPTTTTGAPR
ncbi:hypothetical protein [uncultured Friedmanniella sp.]|uniref:hypothetical protein n=1 Tax=uncultured Friedmanniella sp. TaxID=335381 RepID=UPI0035CA1E54